MELKNTSFVLFICFFFISLFFLNHLFALNQHLTMNTFEDYAQGDYGLHLKRTQAFIGVDYCYDNLCSNQPYLFHLFASPFSFRETGFFFFSILFIGLVIPYTIYHVTKEPFSAFFYFTVSNFFWISRGMFTNIIAIWFVLLFFAFKRHWQRALLLFLSILTHSYGFYLALITCFLIYLFETKWSAVFPSFIAGCEGFSKNAKEIISKGLTEDHTIANPSNEALTIGKILSVIWLNAPLPFFLIGLWGLFKSRQFALICLTIFSFWVLAWSWRFQLLIGLLCVVGVSFAFGQLSRRKKYFLLLMALAMGVIQFYNFWWESARVLGIIC